MERKCLHSTNICLLLIVLLSKTSALAVVASYNNDADDSTAYLAASHFDRLVYSYNNNNNNNNNNNDSSMLYYFNNHSAAATGSKTQGGDDSAGLLTTGANHRHYHEAAAASTIDAELDLSRSSMFCSGSILQCLFLSLVLGLMIISTIIGNSFVIAAVVLERNLQGVANYLIVSLAVADLTVAIMVMPIGAYQEVYHTWNLGGVLCDIWTSFDVLCCTASILHLVAIALDRYWAITNVHYGAKRTAKRIVTMIVFIWTLSALMAISPHLFGLSYEASSSERCQLTNNLTFQLVSTLGAFYLPLVVMCIIYWKIFQSAKFRIRSKGAGMTSVQRRKEEEKARRRSPKSILPSDEQNNKVETGEAGEEKDDGHNVATRFLIRTSRSLSFSARKSPANSSSQKPPSITNITGNNHQNSKTSLATGGNTTNNETSFTRNNLRQQSLRVVRADRTDDIAKRKPALELPSTSPQVPTNQTLPTTLLLLPTSNHTTTATTDTTSTSTTKESAVAQKQSESVSPNLSTSPNQGHKSIKSIIKKNMFVFSHIALLQKARQAAERPFDDELYDNQSDEDREEEEEEAYKASSQKKPSPPKQQSDQHHHQHQHKSQEKKSAAMNRQNSSYDNNTSSYQTTDNNTKPNTNQMKKYLEDKRVNKSNNTQPVARKSNTFVFGLKEEDERTKAVAAAAARKLSSVLTDRIGAGHDYYHRESQVSQKSGGWLQPDKSLAMYEDSTLFNVASSTRASYAYSENDTEEGSMLDLNRQHALSSSSSTRLNPPPLESSSSSTPVAAAVTGASSFAAVVAAAAHANRVKKISFNENEKSPNNTTKASQTNNNTNKLKTTSNILNEFERTRKSNQPQRLNMIASISSQSRSSTTSTSNNDYSAKCKENNDIEHTLSTSALAEPSHNTPHNNNNNTRIAGSNNSFRIEGTKTSDLAKKRARIDIKRERKAAKTLGVIMTCFIVCWLPFFLMQILFSICSDCYLSQLLERSRLVTILTWSGYLNSLLNPVIYTIFSPDFRIAFAKILFGKYSSRNRRPRK